MRLPLPALFGFSLVCLALPAPAMQTGTGTSPTTTTLTPTTPLTFYYGGPANGTFAVDVAPGAPTATGDYTLLDNGVAVPICTALPLTATCPYGQPILLDAGVHAFVVEYLGDAYNAPSSSPPVVYTVLPDLTTAQLTATPTIALQGQPVALAVAVAGNAATPAGSVTFYDGPNPLATQDLDANGDATLSTSTLSLGIHTITAEYPATLDFDAAVSNSVAVTVKPVTGPLKTVVNINSSINPSAPAQPVTFTAGVTAQGALVVVPTGQVTFFDGSSALATVTLNANGIATFETSSLATGSHAITAGYLGAPAGSSSGGFAASVSPVLTQVVTSNFPTGFTLTVSPVPVRMATGGIASLLVTVAPLNGFNQPVLLSCAGLPRQATCTFEQTTIPAGGGTTTLFLASSGPHPCGSSTAYSAGIGVLAMPLLTGLFLLRGRRRFARLFAVAVVAGIALLSGCGTCTDLGTLPGTYTFTVTGTAQGGPVTEVQSQAIPMTVGVP